MNIPDSIYKLYDNGGRTFDRYAVLLKGTNDYLTLSHNPDSLQGFSQMGRDYVKSESDKEISWEQLPSSVQKHICKRVQQ